MKCHCCCSSRDKRTQYSSNDFIPNQQIKTASWRTKKQQSERERRSWETWKKASQLRKAQVHSRFDKDSKNDSDARSCPEGSRGSEELIGSRVTMATVRIDSENAWNSWNYPHETNTGTKCTKSIKFIFMSDQQHTLATFKVFMRENVLDTQTEETLCFVPVFVSCVNHKPRQKQLCDSYHSYDYRIWSSSSSGLNCGLFTMSRQTEYSQSLHPARRCRRQEMSLFQNMKVNKWHNNQ